MILRRLWEEENNQRGEVMLEASFILVSVILLLMALLSLSFLFYQEAMMTSVANEIAADIAKNYKYTDMEMGESSITLDDVTGVRMFRMSFGKTKMEESHEARAKSYAQWRVSMATLGIHSSELEVVCEVTSSGIGRAFVKVTLSQRSDYFLSSILDLAGIADEDTIFGATAYAECMDLMGYTSMVNFTQYASQELSIFNSIGGFYDSVRNFIEKLGG